MSLQFIQDQFEESAKVLKAFMADENNFKNIEAASQLMLEAIQNNRKIISCGNGGSMSDAMHFAEELTGRYRDNRPSLPAIAISDSGYLTCAGNDYGYDFVFSRFVEGMGNSGDVLLGISTSGNSKNVINAVQVAKEKGMKTVVLSGKDGGNLADLADVEIRVPHFGYADRIQEIHIKVIHTLIGLIEKGIGY